VAWQASGEPYRGEIVIPSGNARAPEITLTEAPVRTRHLRKDGTPYGRYK
jgi:hypothetical protein